MCKLQSPTPSSFQRFTEGLTITKTGSFLRTYFSLLINEQIQVPEVLFCFFIIMYGGGNLARKIFKAALLITHHRKRKKSIRLP